MAYPDHSFWHERVLAVFFSHFDPPRSFSATLCEGQGTCAYTHACIYCTSSSLSESRSAWQCPYLYLLNYWPRPNIFTFWSFGIGIWSPLKGVVIQAVLLTCCLVQLRAWRYSHSCWTHLSKPHLQGCICSMLFAGPLNSVHFPCSP